MVVSSETPRHSFTTSCQRCGSSAWTFFSRSLMTFSSWLPDGVLTQSLPFFELVAFVDQQRDVAAVVDHQLRTLAAGMAERLIGAPPVFFERFALPGEHRNAGGGDGGRGVILRGENVAARPAHGGAEIDQRLDQHGGLNGHVQRAGDAHARQRLVRRRTSGGSTSGRAFRARRWRSLCGPNRPASCRRLCIRWRFG